MKELDLEYREMRKEILIQKIHDEIQIIHGDMELLVEDIRFFLDDDTDIAIKKDKMIAIRRMKEAGLALRRIIMGLKDELNLGLVANFELH